MKCLSLKNDPNYCLHDQCTMERQGSDNEGTQDMSNNVLSSLSVKLLFHFDNCKWRLLIDFHVLPAKDDTNNKEMSSGRVKLQI